MHMRQLAFYGACDILCRYKICYISRVGLYVDLEVRLQIRTDEMKL